MGTKPLKRHPSLRNLSREHHDILVFTLRLSKGIKRDIAIDRLVKYSRWFWESYLQEHFRLEEKHLFPLISDDHPMKEQALEQHQQIQAYFEQAGLDIQQLKIIRDMVNQHIRFEEREFFMFIQKKVDKSSLANFAMEHKNQRSCPIWFDEFWN